MSLLRALWRWCSYRCVWLWLEKHQQKGWLLTTWDTQLVHSLSMAGYPKLMSVVNVTLLLKHLMKPLHIICLCKQVQKYERKTHCCVEWLSLYLYIIHFQTEYKHPNVLTPPNTTMLPQSLSTHFCTRPLWTLLSSLSPSTNSAICVIEAKSWFIWKEHLAPLHVFLWPFLS